MTNTRIETHQEKLDAKHRMMCAPNISLVAAEFALMLSRQLCLTCVIIEQVGQNSANPQQFMHYIAVHAEAKSSSSIVPAGHDRSHVVSSKRACNRDQQRYLVIA